MHLFPFFTWLRFRKNASASSTNSNNLNTTEEKQGSWNQWCHSRREKILTNLIALWWRDTGYLAHALLEIWTGYYNSTFLTPVLRSRPNQTLYAWLSRPLFPWEQCHLPSWYHSPYQNAWRGSTTKKTRKKLMVDLQESNSLGSLTS